MTRALYWLAEGVAAVWIALCLAYVSAHLYADFTQPTVPDWLYEQWGAR